MHDKYAEAAKRRARMPFLLDGTRTIKSIAEMVDRDDSCINTDMRFLEGKGYSFEVVGYAAGAGNRGRSKLYKCTHKPAEPEPLKIRGHYTTAGKDCISTTYSDDRDHARDFQVAYRRAASEALARRVARAAA